jgi:hypothetical protein
MQALDKLAWEILDATADDWEDLEQIYLAVCFEVTGEEAGYRRVRPSVLLPEIADRILRLVAARLLAARWGESGDPVTDLDDLSYVWRAWFSMTPQGREVWAASEYTAPA